MFSKFELVVGGLCVVAMAASLYLLQAETRLALNEQNAIVTGETQTAGIVFVDKSDSQTVTGARSDAFREAIDNDGNFSRMVIDDVKEGSGVEVKDGDTVAVHYAGRLQSGQEFDNSRQRGEAFEFTVGAGQVIKGWEEGLVGMKVGGERILVIPPEKAYGEQGIGPIPGGATLVFSIELIEIK